MTDSGTYQEVVEQLTELRDQARASGTWSIADKLTPSVPAPGFVFWYSTGVIYTGATRVVADEAGRVSVGVVFGNPLKSLDYATADSMLCGYWGRASSDDVGVAAAASELSSTGFTITVDAVAAGSFNVYWQVGEYYVRAEDQNEE